jgi:hypothetical protein
MGVFVGVTRLRATNANVQLGAANVLAEALRQRGFAASVVSSARTCLHRLTREGMRSRI